MNISWTGKIALSNNIFFLLLFFNHFFLLFLPVTTLTVKTALKKQHKKNNSIKYNIHKSCFFVLYWFVTKYSYVILKII